MFVRWITGTLLAGVTLLAAWLSPFLWFALILFLLGVASLEWGRLSGTPSYLYLVTLELALLILATRRFEFLPLLLMIPGFGVMYHQDPNRIQDVVWTAAGVVWLAIPAALLFYVRTDFGFTLLMLLLLGTALQDTLALYIGRQFGSERPFTPVISPNKTWAGFGGSLLGATGTFFVAGFVLGWPWSYGLLIGLTLGVVGQVGDLSLSALKRRARVKDTGQFFPGHGGILDRVDGLIFNVCAFYFFCTFFGGLT